MRNKILIASTLRNKKENATQADKTLLEADPNYANVEHSRAIKKACADAAKRMEDLLFYSAVEFKKGDWIVKIRWYMSCPSMTNRHGDRFYKKGDLQWIGCASIVRSVKSKDVIMR